MSSSLTAEIVLKPKREVLYLRYVQFFVHGALLSVYYNPEPSGVSHSVSEERVRHVSGKVWNYLQGTQILDASCDDVTCSIAHEAEKAFMN